MAIRSRARSAETWRTLWRTLRRRSRAATRRRWTRLARRWTAGLRTHRGGADLQGYAGYSWGDSGWERRGADGRAERGVRQRRCGEEEGRGRDRRRVRGCRRQEVRRQLSAASEWHLSGARMRPHFASDLTSCHLTLRTSHPARSGVSAIWGAERGKRIEIRSQ